jgi:hypothetical protein
VVGVVDDFVGFPVVDVVDVSEELFDLGRVVVVVVVVVLVVVGFDVDPFDPEARGFGGVPRKDWARWRRSMSWLPL